jgi:energy-coupling factor transport system substrate-specific component
VTAAGDRVLLPVRARPAVVLAGVSAVGVAAFGWPFVLGPGATADHAGDAPWLFLLLLTLLGCVAGAELTAGGMDAKTVALLGMLAAVGGALRVLGAGTAGLEPMFFLLVVAGRVLGPGVGVLLGGLAVLVGGFLTGGVGPWTPFQMVAASWVTLGAALLPPASGRAERWLLAGYGLLAGIGYGVVMNLWFWPFFTAAPEGTGFTPGAPVAENARAYAVFYLATSLGWDVSRGVLTAALCLLAGRPVLATLRRGVRRAAFGDAPAPSAGGGR